MGLKYFKIKVLLSFSQPRILWFAKNNNKHLQENLRHQDFTTYQVIRKQKTLWLKITLSILKLNYSTDKTRQTHPPSLIFLFITLTQSILSLKTVLSIGILCIHKSTFLNEYIMSIKDYYGIV